MVRFEESSITFPYKRSLGPVIGAFMTALTEKKILGIRNGDGVLVPPMEWDPATGAETVVFSCFNQDQSLDRVDFASLRTRLSQNGVQEKLTKQWIDRCLHQIGWRPAAAAE